jgi:ElaB/YqjD/DUF883 family membrane-anchored ribosome-binding protein
MSNMSHMARDTVSEARGAARDAGKAASASAADIQDDLLALRDDVAKLTQQLAAIATTRGGAAWRKAKTNAGDAIAEAQDKGLEAVDAVRAMGETMIDALDESLEKRPYVILGLALGAGFLLGAARRR